MSGWLGKYYSGIDQLSSGIPSVVLSVRCLLPCAKNAPLRLRRKVLKGAFPARPRWQWYLLVLIQAMIWFGFMAWWRLFKVIRQYPMTDISSNGVAVSRQLTDLLYLALACGTDPYSYYVFRLHDWPRSHWMEFVYPQETMNWHAVLSCKQGSDSVALLRNKHAFSKYLTAQGITSVETRQYLPKGEKIALRELLTSEPLFLKPNQGSAMRGCAELTYSDEQQAYHFRSVDPWHAFELTSNEEIEKTINQLVAGAGYLVQPLLFNHHDVAALFTTKDLVTMRIISAWIDGKVSMVSATAEVRSANQGWTFLPLDLETGIVEQARTLQPASSRKSPSVERQAAIPQWPEVCSLVQSAHAGLTDLLTVAWDLAITEKGPCIIEGNTSWNIEAMQISSGIPALRTGLLKAYASAG